MSQTRYGMIGTGMMGQEHLRNIKLLKETKIIAAYEPDLDMQRKAAEYDADIHFANSLEELLKHENLDCLVIASPNFLHVEQLETIFQMRPLPTLVEKPLCSDLEQIQRIKQLQEDYDVPVWVAMEYRYMPPIAVLIQKIQEATGTIRMLTIREHRFPFLEKVNHWNRFNRYTGGTLVEKCCHFFDLMRHILQSEPVKLMASGGVAVNHLEESYQGETPDIWDNAYVIVEFENQARAMLELCMFAEGSRYQEELSAVGELGKIECFVPAPQRFWNASLGEPPTPQIVVSPRFPTGPRTLEIPLDSKLLEAGDHHGSTFYQHEKFLQVVRGSGKVEVSLDDGIKAVAMGLAAQESAKTHQVIDFQEFLR